MMLRVILVLVLTFSVKEVLMASTENSEQPDDKPPEDDTADKPDGDSPPKPDGDPSPKPEKKSSDKPESKKSKPKQCPIRICSDHDNRRVCGVKKVGLCNKVTIFDNQCEMDKANDCGDKYEPCVRNQCWDRMDR